MTLTSSSFAPTLAKSSSSVTASHDEDMAGSSAASTAVTPRSHNTSPRNMAESQGRPTDFCNDSEWNPNYADDNDVGSTSNTDTLGVPVSLMKTTPSVLL